MLTVAHPWLLALAPLPLLIWWLAPAHRDARQGLVVPFLARLRRHPGHRTMNRAVISAGGLLRWLSLWICWLGVVLALARPQIIEPAVTKEVPGRDVLLAVDLSGSMETRDFKNARGETVDRLTAVKEVLGDFLTKRKGDRVGLIFFGSAAFVQAPFTEDLKVCRQLLDEAQVRMAGPQTAFGDALGLAINVFDRSPVKDRVLIALTDGNDTASQVPPAKAAQIAKDKGIVIHTVAVGDPKAAGEDALDEKTLKEVASTTGGIYAHATDHQQLDGIYGRLDQLEARKAQTLSHRPRRDIYWWPLAVGLIVSFLFHALQLLKVGFAGAAPMAPAGPPLAPVSAGLLAGASPAGFHFIRPEWLLALVLVAFFWWRLRRHGDDRQPWRGIVAPHLLPHLLRGEEIKSRFDPLRWLIVVWTISALAIAGPAWKRAPAPFAEDTAALALVVKVSPSMKTEDVEPSRQERAAQKIHDLSKERAGAKTALIAYAGTAHLVMPLTKDAGIIDTFAQALDPKIMPSPGDAVVDALKLADRALAEAGGGSILWITDGVSPEQSAALAAWRKSSGTPLRVLPPLLPGPELDAVNNLAHSVNAGVVSLAADDSDVRELARLARFATVAGPDGSQRWLESGYWLTPVIALLLLPFFRKGWMPRTSATAWA